MEEAHHQAVDVVEEHMAVFEIDGGFVGDGVEELLITESESPAASLSEGEEAAEDDVLALERDGHELADVV